MKKTIGLVSLLAGISLSTSAFAIDYLEFAKTEIMGCAHPKSEFQKAEYDRAPTVVNGNNVARVKIFYKGFIKNNSMTVEIKHDANKKPELIKVEVLDDTAGTGTQKCKYFDTWQEIK
ncbi:MAG: hypothetical protein RIT27_1438 [Pseudomonadota bacterium]|jgi:hypothetical protein